MSAFKRYALIYHDNFGFNILPLRGKRPMIQWDKWQSEKQSAADIETMDWTNSTGLGTVSGINELRILDLDAVEDFEILDLLIEDLGLPKKYPWVIQSGSGEGFHIYFRCAEGQLLINKLGDKAVHKLSMKNENYCKHIELRWKNCQTALPFSMHESGGIYNFYYAEPKEIPDSVDIEKVVETLEKYCTMNRESVSVPLRIHPSDFAGQVRGNTPYLPSSGPDKAGNEPNEFWRDAEGIKYDKEKLEAALKYLSENLPEGCYEEWYRIGFALVPLGEQGEKYFIEMSLNNKNYKDSETELQKKFAQLAKDYDGRISIGTVYHIAELYGWKKPVIKFWYLEDGMKVKISRTRYKKFLESEGFCKYRMDASNGAGTNYIFVRIVDNVVEEISCIEVKEFVMNYIFRLPIEEFEKVNRANIVDALIKSANQLFTNQFLEFLITRNIEFMKEAHDRAYFYFQNGFTEVSANDVRFIGYKKLNRHIWKKQIIQRNFIRSECRSVFEDLLYNICRNDKERYNALKSGIGYLLHTYKDPSNAKAVIFIDEKMSEEAYGRSGKGLVIKGISQVRNIVVEDGRNFNPSRNFAFQRVKPDTNIIAIEDIRQKFPFERLFSIITDGITIERKNKDEIFLRAHESPKVVISTNFTISGVDDSTIDRQFIIEFSDYYNKDHRPIDDFGKLLYEAWNVDEWNDFDCYMIECLQFYLKHGLRPYKYVNVEKKKLIDETCIEFAEFSEEFTTLKEYDKKLLFDAFKREYEDLQQITQSKFTRWLKVYGRVNNFEILETKSGAQRIISYKNKVDKESNLSITLEPDLFPI